MKNQSNYDALLHRLVSVMLLPDGSQPGQAIANLQRAAELKLMSGFYDKAREEAIAMIAMVRYSKEGQYRDKTDEEICAVIMKSIREKDAEVLGK